jgi:hypothetical protein
LALAEEPEASQAIAGAFADHAIRVCASATITLVRPH